MINLTDMNEIIEILNEGTDATAIIDFFGYHVENVAEKAKDLIDNPYINTLNIELTKYWAKVQTFEFKAKDCQLLTNTINGLYNA